MSPKTQKRVTAPLMLVGGIRSYEVAERLVADGTTGYVSLRRPLIREPDLKRDFQLTDGRYLNDTQPNLPRQQKLRKGTHVRIAA